MCEDLQLWTGAAKRKKRIKAFMIHKGILNQDFQNYIKTFKDKRKQATVKRISLIS